MSVEDEILRELTLSFKWACEKGIKELVKILLKDGRVNPTLTYGIPDFPLIIACHHGYTEIIKMLLEDDRVNPSANGPYNNPDFPLRLMCQDGNTEIVKLLLKDNRVNPCAIGNDGKPDYPLRISCKNGYTDIVKLLLATGKVNPVTGIKYCHITLRLDQKDKLLFLLTKLPQLYNTYLDEISRDDINKDGEYFAEQLWDYKDALTIEQREKLKPFWDNMLGFNIDNNTKKQTKIRILADLPENIKLEINNYI
jgi:hypothetical protein